MAGIAFAAVVFGPVGSSAQTLPPEICDAIQGVVGGRTLPEDLCPPRSDDPDVCVSAHRCANSGGANLGQRDCGGAAICCHYQ
jgi:hypothetical protein